MSQILTSFRWGPGPPAIPPLAAPLPVTRAAAGSCYNSYCHAIKYDDED